MGKINNVVSEKALKRRTDLEVKLLARLEGETLELFNEFIDAMVEYEDCLCKS